MLFKREFFLRRHSQFNVNGGNAVKLSALDHDWNDIKILINDIFIAISLLESIIKLRNKEDIWTARKKQTNMKLNGINAVE